MGLFRKRAPRIIFTTDEISFALLALAHYRIEFGPPGPGDARAFAAIEKVASVVQETSQDTLRLPPYEIVG
jgi:hypothetical protein